MLALLLHASALAAPTSSTAGPVVKLADGAIMGKTLGSVNNFLGLPFAAPPVGKGGRWAPPKPVTPWTGTKDASDFKHNCMQEPDAKVQRGRSCCSAHADAAALLTLRFAGDGLAAAALDAVRGLPVPQRLRPERQAVSAHARDRVAVRRRLPGRRQ